MAGNISKIQIEVRVDGKGGIKVLRQIGTESEKTGKKGTKGFKNMSRSAGVFNKRINLTRGLAVKLGAAFAAFAVASAYGMKKAIDAASDLQEVQGKFDVVFAKHSKQAEGMAKILVKSYAMSEREAKQYMSSIQDLLVPMGMAANKALLMSNEVVKLSADLASFNNLPTAQVMLDIQSALVGNFETMKKYGVILNEHVVKEKAFEMGLYSGKGMVDANTKALVAYKLMIASSTAAIGDQQRTMSSYANQMKQLRANVENIAAAIGDELLPKVTAWVNQLNTMIETNPQIIKQMGDFAKNVLGLATAMGKVIALGAEFTNVWVKTFQAMGLASSGIITWKDALLDGANAVDLLSTEQGRLQLQTRFLEQQIISLKKRTEGQIFYFAEDKAELKELENRLKHFRLQVEYGKTLAARKAPGRLEEALADPSKYYGAMPPVESTVASDSKVMALSKQQIKAMQEQEAFAIKMANAEEQRMRDREQLGLDMLESFRTAKMSETELALDALDKQFLAYDDFVQDESALYDWYVEKYNKIMEGANAKKLAMTEKMYSDLKFTSDDYYAYQLNQLQRQSDGYEKFTGNTALAHLWLTEQIKALDKERLEAADKSNQHLIDLSQRTADAIEDNFSQFFRDFFRGELDSAEDYFRKFCHSLTDSFSDMLGQMTKEMIFGGGSSGGSGLLKSLFSGVYNLFDGGGKDAAGKRSLAVKAQSSALIDQSTIVEKLTSGYINFEKDASVGMEDLTISTNVVKKITDVFANERIISSQTYIPLLTTENTQLMQQQLIVSQLTAEYQMLYAVKQLTGQQGAGGAQLDGTQSGANSPDAMNNPQTWFEKMTSAGKSAYEWLAKIGSSVWGGLKYLWSEVQTLFSTIWGGLKYLWAGVQTVFSTISAWISKIPVIGPALSEVGAFLGKIPGIGVALKWVGGLLGGGGAAAAATAAQQGMAVMVLHKGGRVGRDPAPTRNVPAFVFANAPRLHEGWPGLRKDEFPSILKYDETVLPPGVKPVNNVSNLTISVPVTIEGQGDDRLASKLSYEMEETAKRVMREEMR